MKLQEIEERLRAIETEDCCSGEVCSCSAFFAIRELRRDIERDRLLAPEVTS